MADNEVQFQEEDYADFGQPATGNQENQAGGEQQDQDFFGEGHGQEPGHTGEEGQGEGQGEYQGYEAHQEDNQGGDFGQAQYQDQGHFEQQQQGGHTGGDDYDDFFGSQSKPQDQPSSAQFASNQQAFGMPSGGSPGMGGGMNTYDPNYDPEEEERLERLRRIEQERNQRLDQKAREEREKKQEKIAEAAKELARWHSERDQNNEKRRQINKQNQEIQNDTKAEEEYKNPWDKIVANIATKEGEYPGSKDVTRFRQSLVNKKADEAKGGVEKLGLF